MGANAARLLGVVIGIALVDQDRVAAMARRSFDRRRGARRRPGWAPPPPSTAASMTLSQDWLPVLLS